MVTALNQAHDNILKIEANKIEIIMNVIAMPAKYYSISVFYA